MKKKDLEKAQQNFRGNTNLDTDTLRNRVQSDLNIIKDAYDTGSIALTEIEKRLSTLGAEGESASNQTRDLAFLVRAYADIAKSLIALRGEGRVTIREATTAAVTLPGPESAVGEALHSHSTKISSAPATPRRKKPSAETPGTPSTIGQYLQAHIGDQDVED